MDPAFAERNVNEGFSGGEKKRHEILQLELLKPKIAILDETDSGLDVDALRVVSEGVNRVRETGEVGTLLITHYTRILRYIKPDFVHVFAERPHRRVRRRRARRQAGGRGLRGIREGWRYPRDTAAGPPRHRGDPQGLPDPGPHGPRRQEARVPGQRGDLAEAAPGARRAERVLRAAQRQRPPRCARARRGGHGAVRGRPRQGRRLHQRAQPRRGDLHQERLRVAQPRGQHARLGRRALPGGPRDRDRHHGDGAPLQHRAVAAALAAHRREAEVVRPHRRRPPRPVQHRRGHHREDEDRLLRAGLQHPGHGQPGRGDRPPRAGGRRAGLHRRLAGRAAHAAGRAGAPGRLRGLHRPQDVRPDRHRRAVGPPGAAGGPAAVPRRRRDDRDRVDALVDVRPRAAQVRGGHARRSPRPSASARPWTTCTAIGMDKIARARARAHRVRGEAARWRSPTCGSSAPPRPRTAARRSPSRSATSTRTTWARSSTSRASRSGSATTARARSACGTEFLRPRERRSICTPRRPRSTPWSTAWSTYGTSSAEGRADA